MRGRLLQPCHAGLQGDFMTEVRGRHHQQQCARPAREPAPAARARCRMARSLGRFYRRHARCIAQRCSGRIGACPLFERRRQASREALKRRRSSTGLATEHAVREHRVADDGRKRDAHADQDDRQRRRAAGGLPDRQPVDHDDRGRCCRPARGSRARTPGPSSTNRQPAQPRRRRPGCRAGLRTRASSAPGMQRDGQQRR